MVCTYSAVLTQPGVGTKGNALLHNPGLAETRSRRVIMAPEPNVTSIAVLPQNTHLLPTPSWCLIVFPGMYSTNSPRWFVIVVPGNSRTSEHSTVVGVEQVPPVVMPTM